MTGDPRVQQLLDDLLDSQSTPEEVCDSCPELLPEIRERWRQLRRVQAELDAMFPTLVAPSATLPDPSGGEQALPQIPGYRVEALLGRGGMGVVFRARHLRLNRVVALKMVLAGAYAGPNERERFQREAEAVAGLQHPNVVQIHDVGESDGRPYFTMEFLEGGSLAKKIAGKPQPARQAASLLATLAGAVHAAHQSGIVHRDLKPANVLLTGSRNDETPTAGGQSSWGTPKISDFGLARRLDSEADLTRTGAALGTPSYMAPEQAAGKVDATGPATDVYALGAILYELLTGRPPFQSESVEETRQQVILQEPAPPSRLNAKIPRDLETICLKCLRKEPRLRYATAAALAADLDCFLRGEAITARPERRWERLARRARRQPILSAAIVACPLFALALLGGGLWLLSERAAAEREVEAERAATERASKEDLREMAEALKASSWPEARAAMERAKGRLGGHGSDELRRRLDQGTRDLALAARFEAIRMNPSAWVGGNIEPPPVERPDVQYEAEFRKAGLGQVHDDPAAVARRIRESNITSAIVSALDHWSSTALDRRRRDWVLGVARLADPDPTGWRDRARDSNLRLDQAALADLIKTAPVDVQSVALLLALNTQLSFDNPERLPFLQRIQQLHPGDFWANLALGDVLSTRVNKPSEAIRYYQATVSIRPRAALPYFRLGTTLFSLNRPEEALELFRQAVAIDPTFVFAQYYVAIALLQLGRHEEVITQLQSAARANPNVDGVYALLGHRLNVQRRHPEALAQFRHALALSPKNKTTQSRLRATLVLLGQGDEAQAAWLKTIEADPANHDTCYGYAEFCLYLGKADEYRRARQSLLTRFGDTTNPYTAERTSRACLLAPATGEELRQAVALAERAAAAEHSMHPAYAHFLFAQGLAEYRQGHFDQAITVMRGDASRVLGPAPGIVLAMALHRTGKRTEARKTLATAIASHDWQAHHVEEQNNWIFHVLRREAEPMILPNLPAFLDGKYQPKDNDERLAFLGACQFANRTRAAAQLYADAFAADPRLAENFKAGYRINAACAAALAGSGRGADATNLSEEERKRWREQARQWLRADLAAWDRTPESAPIASDRARLRLPFLRSEPDLAGIADPTALDKLSADERRECLAVWDELNAVVSRTGGFK